MKVTADKTYMLQYTVYVTLRLKTLRYINLKFTKLIDARARVYGGKTNNTNDNDDIDNIILIY